MGQKKSEPTVLKRECCQETLKEDKRTGQWVEEPRNEEDFQAGGHMRKLIPRVGQAIKSG